MSITSENVDRFLRLLPFVQTFGVELTSAEQGRVVVEMPFDARYSTPPDLYPASIIGALGDIAAISACLSRLPDGWATATLDYTVKVLGPARGRRLRAVGDVIRHGKTISTARAEIWACGDGVADHCGSLLATGRNYEIKA